MQGIALLTAQSVFYFAVMAALFRLRHVAGLGLFYSTLGVMHFLETYLAAVFFIELPFGLISPGSTVMFSGKLAMILLLYMREDAETVRQPVYGLLVGNFLMVGLVIILRLHGPLANTPGYTPDLRLMDQMGVLMVWGTMLLFIDAIGMIMLYERLGRSGRLAAPLRAFLCLAAVLTFDQVCFFAGLHLVVGTPISALIGGWIAKMGAAAAYSGYIWLYLALVERGPSGLAPRRLADVFSALTYRERYEELLGRSRLDPLTGALNREQFETIGPGSLMQALSRGQPVSLAIIDVDHFKAINDNYGHLAGDEVLRRVADAIRSSVRGNDKVFRYGGEEFVVLCEGMDHDDALAHAERLRSVVPEAAGNAVAEPPTISIGVATATGQDDNLVALFHRADRHLYEAKRGGRNRVVGDAA